MGQENVQSQLDGVQRNRVIYERIANEMKTMGYCKSWQQCRTKIKNMTQKYRKVFFLIVVVCVSVLQGYKSTWAI